LAFIKQLDDHTRGSVLLFSEEEKKERKMTEEMQDMREKERREKIEERGEALA